MKSVSRKGFTLVELIVVIAFISILAAMIAPNAYKAVRKAKIAKSAADMKTIRSALLAYATDTGKFPDPFYFRVPGYGHRNDSNDGYNFNSPPLMANEDNVRGWDGPYMDKVATSGLSHPYVATGYTYPGIYWIGGTNIYRQSFDFDGDGTAESTNMISVQLAGLELADALAIDHIFDGNNGYNGRRGSMNLSPFTGGEYYFIYLNVGTGRCGING